VAAAAVCLLVSLTALAGSVGWGLGERASRRREAEGKVLEALEAAGPGLRQGNPWDAGLITAVQKAEAQLSGGLVRPHLRQRVAQLHKDVEMLAEMERIRLDRDHRDEPRSGHEYARAFKEYGIDVETLGPYEAVALLQGSTICEHLVAGLDDWAATLPNVGQGRALKVKLFALARQAGPHPWVDRLREVVLSGSAKELERLARSAPVGELPASAPTLLGDRVTAHRGVVPGPVVDLLRRAQRRSPADFWINFALAYALTNGQPPKLEEAIGFYRAAVALRPQCPGAVLNLGYALQKKGDMDGALAAYREASRLSKGDAMALNNLGGLLCDVKRDYDGAIAAFRQAIRRKKDYALAHRNLGVALQLKGDAEGAIAAYREAVRLNKDDADAHNNLGALLCDVKRDYDGAIAAFREAIRLNKDDAAAHRNLGIALKKKGLLDEAIALSREANRLKKGPRPPPRLPAGPASQGVAKPGPGL
jgi:tetratricopeptide (TPR) repeat protein